MKLFAVPPSAQGGRARSPALPMRALLLLLLLLTAAPLSSALYVEVPAGKKFEVTEQVNPQSSLTFQFSLHPEYLMDVVITNVDNNDAVLKAWKQEESGIFTMEPSETPRNIKVSVSNEDSRFSSKIVSFSFQQDIDFTVVAHKSQIDPIEGSINRISRAMQQLKASMAVMRIQQRNHRSTVGDASRRVLWWSGFQVTAFLVMFLFQIYFLRRFLERKTYV